MSSDIAEMSLSLTSKVSRFQPAHYAPGTFLEGSPKALTSVIYRRPSGDSQRTNTKTDELMRKKHYNVILFSTGKKILKNYKPGCPRDFYGTQLRVVPKTKWWEALGTFTRRWSNMVFKFNSKTHWIYFDKLLKTFWWKVLAFIYWFIYLNLYLLLV